ncbi:MAG: DUF1214 domain-containing protein [bacterium]
MTAPRRYETTEAFRELLDVLRDADQNFLDGFRAVPDEASAMEGYRFLVDVFSVALDCYVTTDAARPEFVKIVSPTRKFGGDNADAYYYYSPVDPARTYRVRGTIGDAVYLSLCVYGGPSDGRWSNRMVSKINNRELTFGADGTFEVVIGGPEQPRNWMALADDAVALVTRDYLIDPLHDRQAVYAIEAVDPAPPPAPASDAELAMRLRRTANFIRDLLNISPVPTPFDANTVQEPYMQQAVTYGWAAPDVAYAMGRWELAEDEALVIEGRSPDCAFWNLCLWNPFMCTYDYRYYRCTVNGGQMRYEADGSWRVIVAPHDPGHPNWLSTAGHAHGLLWFRWFLPAETPSRPTARVVKVAALQTH